MKRKISVMLVMLMLGVVLAHSIVFAQDADEKETLNLNFATPEQLETLPGITPELAQAIFENRPYEWFDDLLKIDGITRELVENLEEHIEVTKLNINTIKMRELQVLPGMTPEIAHAIIEKRTKKPFEMLLELVQFKGIGEQEIELLEQFVVTTPEEIEEKSDKGWQPQPQNLPAP